MRKMTLGLAATVALSMASQAQATTTINFDNLADGVVVTNQYAGVTFSTVPGEEIVTSAQDLGSSPPNFICTEPIGGTLDCVNDVHVDFSSPVSNLSFLAVGDNNTGTIGNVSVYAGVNLLGTVNIVGDGNPFAPQTVNLSGFSGVTRIVIGNITDLVGLGYDDFTFNQSGNGGAVPEPRTWAMMLLGFGAIGLAVRRRRKQRPSSTLQLA